MLQLRLGIDGDALLASLTDDGVLLLVGETGELAHRLAALERNWGGVDHVIGATAVADIDGRPLGAMQSGGAALFNALLPDRLKAFFSHVAPCDLRLTIDARLAGVPWESAFDGRACWQHFHTVSRRLSGQPIAGASADDGPWAPPLKVLLCHAQTPSGARAYANELLLTLQSQPAVHAHLANWRRLHDTESADQMHADVVHLIQPTEQDLASLESNRALALRVSAARLVVLDWADGESEPVSWLRIVQGVAALLATQTNVAVLHRPGRGRGNSQLAQRIYQSLTWGQSLADLRGVEADESGIVSVYGEEARKLFAGDPDTARDRTYRLVTALSYDLVGSTRLMQSLGIENYSAMLRQYHRRFATIVQRWGGLSNQPQGNDGVMSYFGAYHAREDTVQAALHAAQQMLGVAKAMGVEVRIGLATGQVAVNADHLVGLCVHLAARIQSIADANTVLISETTAELAKSRFALEPLAHHNVLKGFAGRVNLFKLNMAGGQQIRDAPARSEPLHLLGRNAEIDQLTAGWTLAEQGRPHWIHITGEAGIGKSRLVGAFIQRLQKQGRGRTVVCRCFAESSERAFSPIIDMLERWFDMTSTDSLLARQAKLNQVAVERGIAPDDHLAISYLMGLPAPDNRKPDLLIPQEPRRRFVMRTMSSWLINQARDHAICFVLEDVQWADPSTLEYLRQLKAGGSGHALLVLVTERTEQPTTRTNPLTDHSIALGRLGDGAVRAMVDSLASGTDLAPRHRDRIVAKSDGVPLFVEMSTRMVIENLQAQAAPGALALTGEYPIPMNLRDLLMQRLDNLGPARLLAQLCSGVGREFSRELLLSLCDANVVNLAKDRLESYLTALLRSGLLQDSSVGEEGQVHYRFRHALVHEVAYQSMWESDRHRLHSAIAQAIEIQMPELAKSQPELLAHHYHACAAPEPGAKWHWLAARKYKAEEAHAESLSHLIAAKALLQQLPATPQRLKSELEIELTMAGQLIATKGYGSVGAGESYLAALALAQGLNNQKAVLRAQLGLEAYHLMRADFSQAFAYLSQAQHTAREFDDPLTRAQCLFALANVLHHKGRPKAMLITSNLCLNVCRGLDAQGKLVQSPEVISLMYSAVCLWETGQVDLALQRAQEGVNIAQQLGQRLGLGQALGMQAMVLMWCGELAEAEEISGRAIQVCEAGGHDMWTAHARLIHGSCISEQGEPEKGIPLMDAGYALWTSTGTIVTRTFYLALRAPAYAAIGRVDLALDLINEACRIVTEHGERYYEAEVLRIKGEILLLQATDQDVDTTAQADATFALAKTTALAQGYHSLGLRVAISRARRHVQLGDRAAVVGELQAALAALNEGHATRDQRVAREMLTQWTD